MFHNVQKKILMELMVFHCIVPLQVFDVLPEEQPYKINHYVPLADYYSVLFLVEYWFLPILVCNCGSAL